MRDENGFKCHIASESHVRNMQTIGEDPRKAINDFSRQFQSDFVQLLRTGHGEKKVNLNRFYNEYIGNKEHMHMNATKWASLTEFAKHLGREGIVRVEEDTEKTEKGVGGASGLMISWVDNSPENLRRQEAVRKRERQDKGDEEREQRLIMQQIKRAKRDLADAEEEDAAVHEADEDAEAGETPKSGGIKRNNGEKVVLNFGAKKPQPQVQQPQTAQPEPEKPLSPPLTDPTSTSPPADKAPSPPITTTTNTTKPAAPAPAPAQLKPSFSLAATSSKPKNVFAAATKKKNALGSSTIKAKSLGPGGVGTSQKPMSEAERIMKEELERKSVREFGGGGKRQRVS